MRVDDAVLKSVCFIGTMLHEDSASYDFDPFGTGFFVSISSSIHGGKFHCLVTAKHVVDGLKGQQVCVALNTRSGERTVYKFEQNAKWWFHPTDKLADLAILPFSVEPEDDITAVGVEDLFLTAANREKYKIGVGDEVFITGLFTYAAGAKRIRPIVRHGNIAMMADEPIQTRSGFIDVCLIEARSIGGLSGSPVFARETFALQWKDKEGRVMRLGGFGRIQLLGLCIGHWDIDEKEMNIPKPKRVASGGVNMGIALVVPATKILEVLNQSELATMRRQEEDRKRAEIPEPTLDSVATPYGRFKKLAGQVLSVPHDAIEQREKAYQAERKNRPARGPQKKRR